jgi:hypothetical protein
MKPKSTTTTTSKNFLDGSFWGYIKNLFNYAIVKLQVTGQQMMMMMTQSDLVRS